jgi:hypothetical protein
MVSGDNDNLEVRSCFDERITFRKQNNEHLLLRFLTFPPKRWPPSFISAMVPGKVLPIVSCFIGRIKSAPTKCWSRKKTIFLSNKRGTCFKNTVFFLSRSYEPSSFGVHEARKRIATEHTHRFRSECPTVVGQGVRASLTVELLQRIGSLSEGIEDRRKHNSSWSRVRVV